MDYNTRNYINNLAQIIINEYNIEIPITDMKNIVRRIGGTIEEKIDFNELCDGTIKKIGDNSFEIAISPFQNEQRKAFTIAHELGHLFLHMGFRTNFELWEHQSTIYKRFGTSEQEYQANEFAAALLMPEDEYKKVLYEHLDDYRVNIKNVADYFHVSVSAATNRGRFLGYFE